VSVHLWLKAMLRNMCSSKTSSIAWMWHLRAAASFREGSNGS